MKKRLAAVLLTLALVLAGCISSNAGGGFDMNRLIRNPLVMVVVALVAVYAAFKMGGKKD